MPEPKQIRQLDGMKAVLYMLFSIEAKLRVQTDLLIEMADILTEKNPDQIRIEVLLKTLQELKKVRSSFVESDELLNVINNMKL